MSVVIEADRGRVWRALTEPSELMAWDDRVLAGAGDSRGAPGDPAAAYPQKGQRLRWRIRLGGVPVVLHEQPLEVVPMVRLGSTLKVGSLRLEQTYTLAEESLDPPRTRRGMKLVTASSVPVMGDVIDRFGVRKLAAERIAQTLHAVQSWCHMNP